MEPHPDQDTDFGTAMLVRELTYTAKAACCSKQLFPEELLISPITFLV